ncbi:MAG: hypothetical protein ACP5XB_16680, partial [Isosphaeraceae bacterium]
MENGVVGGQIYVQVWAPGGMDIMQSATLTVSGAMQSQTYQNSSGTTTPLSGPLPGLMKRTEVRQIGVAGKWK